MRYTLNLLDSKEFEYTLSGELSTSATYGGMLIFPVKVLSPVGTVLTVVGEIPAYVS